jgi:hypothetical protein
VPQNAFGGNLCTYAVKKIILKPGAGLRVEVRKLKFEQAGLSINRRLPISPQNHPPVGKDQPVRLFRSVPGYEQRDPIVLRIHLAQQFVSPHLMFSTVVLGLIDRTPLKKGQVHAGL